MRLVAAVFFALLVSALVVGAASAGAKVPSAVVLYTVPQASLPDGFPAPMFYTCDILNVSASIHNVTISLLDSDGLAVTGAVQTVALNPGQATRLLTRSTNSDGLPIFGPGLHYCKFEVEGSGDDYRASMSFWLNELVIVPAQ